VTPDRGAVVAPDRPGRQCVTDLDPEPPILAEVEADTGRRRPGHAQDMTGLVERGEEAAQSRALIVDVHVHGLHRGLGHDATRPL